MLLTFAAFTVFFGLLLGAAYLLDRSARALRRRKLHDDMMRTLSGPAPSWPDWFVLGANPYAQMPTCKGGVL